MKKYLLPLFLLCFAATVYATPPSDMKLSYAAGALDVKMRHVTREPREHYIHTIKVFINGAAPQIFYYPFQRYPSEFAVSIPLALNPGDKIVVKAQCIQGGSSEAELSIPAAEEAIATATPAPADVVPVEQADKTPSPYGR